VTLLVRWRRAIAGALAAVLALLTMTVPPDLSDFSGAGDLLLHGRFGGVYAAAWNQAGPVQLLVSRLLAIGLRADGTPSPLIVVLVDVVLVVGAMWLCRRSLRFEAAAGLLALLWVAAPLPWNGHPAELAVPVLWAYGIIWQRRDRPLLAAAALALGIAIAPWAILGIPALLAAASPSRTDPAASLPCADPTASPCRTDPTASPSRTDPAAGPADFVAPVGPVPARPVARVLRTGLLAVALGAAAYVPFVLTGHFAMFEQRWGVDPGTVAALLSLHDATWWLRPLQAAVVVLGVAAVAWRLRDHRLAAAAVPLTAALLRVLTDPVAHPYYWFPVAVATLLLLAMRPALETAGLALLALLAGAAAWTIAGPLAALLLLAVVIRRDTTTPAPTALPATAAHR
jgi:hypothetical protein